MAALELAAVLALANTCVPSLPHVRERLVAHAMVESSFDPLVVRDNTTSATYHFGDAASAWRKASSLVAAGHSVDSGITQENSQHWPTLLSGPLVFHPKANFCAGAVILIQDYQAACLYNSGRPYCDPAKYPAAIDHAQAVIRRLTQNSALGRFPSTQVPVDELRVTEETPNRAPDPCADIPRFDAWAREDCKRQYEQGK